MLRDVQTDIWKSCTKTLLWVISGWWTMRGNGFSFFVYFCIKFFPIRLLFLNRITTVLKINFLRVRITWFSAKCCTGLTPVPGADCQLFVRNIPEHLCLTQPQPWPSPLQEAEWDWMWGQHNSAAWKEMLQGPTGIFKGWQVLPESCLASLGPGPTEWLTLPRKGNGPS